MPKIYVTMYDSGHVIIQIAIMCVAVIIWYIPTPCCRLVWCRNIDGLKQHCKNSNVVLH